MRTRSEIGRRKADQVMAAARSLFLERGFSGTSVEDIATRARVSKPTVYSHFCDKRGLFIAFIQAEVEAVAGSMLDFEDRLDGVRADLERFGRAYLDIVLKPSAQALFRLVLTESAAFPEIGAAFYKTTIGRMEQRLSGRLADWVALGALDIDDLTLASHRFLELCRADLHYKALMGVCRDIPDAERTVHIRNAVDAFRRIYQNGVESEAHTPG
ncbi:TetR/AcrR family transcriptional regulator [Roseospira marina]|uniref:TetR/AcrR family transcriptional regulator n=1 Tax=Roseospira marina TaxID=140057 RepID=A0A5M6ICF2_9PROT|nr:TetR/AcrR family transcriptional regulator [Roseospira marina]KAA5605960.1 TetR/AcrR family transcriptional regulator [Roseospira marina]MBB4313194.1 AcrR family transcriptional regulator [Roseospira marina]MBB5086065.1 AcrR family transcriptional regulator [Roseospira marina]